MPHEIECDHLKPWLPATYRIEIEGLLEKAFSDRFAGMRITHRKRADQSVVTYLIGPVRDQSELTGVLNGLADMRLPILSVKRVLETLRKKKKPGEPSAPTSKKKGRKNP